MSDTSKKAALDTFRNDPSVKVLVSSKLSSSSYQNLTLGTMTYTDVSLHHLRLPLSCAEARLSISPRPTESY